MPRQVSGTMVLNKFWAAIVLLEVGLNTAVSVRVLKVAPEDTPWDSQAYLTPSENPSFPSLNGLTVCYRLKLFRFLPTIYWVDVFNYFNQGPDTPPSEIRSFWTESGPVFSLRNQFVAFSSIEVKLMRWYHHCFSFDYDTGRYSMVLDGELIEAGTHVEKFTETKSNGSFWIGAYDGIQCQTSKPDCKGILSADLAALNIWSKSFTLEEMFKFTACNENASDVDGGDVLNWDQANWTFINNVVEYETTLADICLEKEESFMAFLELRPFDEIYDFCQSMGAQMASPKTPKEYQALQNSTSKFFNKGCKSFFLGWTDRHSEGTFVDENSRKSTGDFVPLPEEMGQFWSYGEPNGGRFESCAEIKADGMWNDMPCTPDTASCTVCFFPKRPLLTLRGLCPVSPFDKQYIATTNYQNDKPVVKGYFHSNIVWDLAWQLRSVTTNVTYAQLLSKNEAKYPVGRQEWKIVKDPCFSGEDVTVNLTLTACSSGQYTCDNGHCIDIELRCNNLKHCLDGSDEVECGIVYLPEGYMKSAAPPPLAKNQESSTQGGLPIRVEVSIASFADINVTKMKMTVDFLLTLMWYDRRLQYHHLKSSIAMNTLSLEDLKSMWIPEISFANTDGNQMTNVDDSTEAYVMVNGPYHLNSASHNRETKVFEGSENPIIMHHKYTVDFNCDFKLDKYPFETQKCFMTFQLTKTTNEMVKMIFDDIKYSGTMDLIEYKVVNITAGKPYLCGRENLYSCLQGVVTLKRRVGNQLLITYLPTTCILLIVCMTNYFKIEHYDTRIMVALTGMLVIASLLVSTSASLPKTSYMKLIDLWMIFCFLVPFLVVILHTIIEFLGDYNLIENLKIRRVAPVRSKSGKIAYDKKTFVDVPTTKGELARRRRRLQMRVEYFSRILVPSIFVIFNVVYWSVAASQEGGIVV